MSNGQMSDGQMSDGQLSDQMTGQTSDIQNIPTVEEGELMIKYNKLIQKYNSLLEEYTRLYSYLKEIEKQLEDYQRAPNKTSLGVLSNTIKNSFKELFNVTLGQLSRYDAQGKRKYIGVPLLDPLY